MMFIISPADVAAPGLVFGLLALTIGALVVFFCLIVVIESAVLQWMRWGTFRRSLKGSFLMNLASTLFGFAVLSLVPRLGLLGILFAYVLSVFIESLVLIKMKPGERRRNVIISLVANLASYLVLVLPTFIYSLQDR
jgi:hypothetical protein